MKDDLNNKKENNSIDEWYNNIKEDLSKLKIDFDKKIVNRLNIFNLNEHLNQLKKLNNKELPMFIDLFSLEYLFFFRILLINEKSQRRIILEILKKCIELNPLFTNKILESMTQIIICKILEDSKNSSFEERYECLRLFHTWLSLSDINFPIIFSQAIVSISKTDDSFKIGCIEFLRELSIYRPDLCSTVGGFRILISSLIEEKLPTDFIDKIIYTLVYIINNSNKRKYFNGFGDFYKIFSIFTKSDFSSGPNNNIEMETKKKKEEIHEENKRLEMKLNNAIYIIKNLILTWPGYFLLINDKIYFSSLAYSLNNDINIIIKKAILKLFKEILELKYDFIDNFNTICSDDKDYIYINKIYLAYIINGLYENHLNENLINFLEDNENNELRNYALKLCIKFNILFAKLSNYDIKFSLIEPNFEQIKNFKDLNYKDNLKEEDIDGGVNVSSFKLFNEDENQNMNKRLRNIHLLDKIYHHLNCRDTHSLNLESLSTEIIISVHSMLNLDYIKQYENQYSLETCKKELFSKDDELLPQLLKNTKVIELKEFQNWDWPQIDSLLDIIEIKKDLIPELNKQKFFKKLLYSFSPSKNLIVKQSWTVNNFFYGAIGNKLFKILTSLDDLSILDSPNEDYIFQKSNSWIKDVMQCMENLFDKNIAEDHPLTIKRIYKTLSRNVFIFLGIISNSNLGDDYLNKQGFYSLLDKFITQSNKYDYLLTLIIDNLNFNSKYFNNWIKKLLINCDNEIKKYVLEHIYCLLNFGKEIIIDVKMIFKALDPEFPECNKIIVSIAKLLINKNKNILQAFKEPSILEKINKVDKTLLYILMREPKIYEFLDDIINKEINNINMDEIVIKYGNEINEQMLEKFSNKEKNKYYLTINLSEIKNLYNHYYEYFWIKQLPVSIAIQIIENQDKRNEYILINYLHYNNNDNNIKIMCHPMDSQNIILDETISGIQIVCLLGRIAISKNCNAINNASNFLSFSLKDILREIMPYKNSKDVFIFQKEGINLILKQNENKNSFSLKEISFIIRIKPDSIIGFKTPINLITELNNNKNGYEKLIKIDAVEKLFAYCDIKDESEIDEKAKNIKSAFWILIKLITKNEFGEKLESRYKILKRIYNFYFKYNDCSMKGTILYLINFAAQNKKLKSLLKTFYVSYFNNTNILFPTKKDSLFLNKCVPFINHSLENDVNSIEDRIKLNSISQEIYNNITNLANNITFKQSITRIEELYRANIHYFSDVNLFVKIYSILSKYKLKESTRRAIMFYFDKCIISSDIAIKSSQLLKFLGENLLNAHKL